MPHTKTLRAMSATLALVLVSFGLHAVSPQESLAGSDSGSSAPKKATLKRITFNHKGCGSGKICDELGKLTLSPGEQFAVVIDSTDIAAFSYGITGVKVTTPERQDPDKFGLMHGANPVWSKKELFYNHDPQYGGYIVTVVANEGKHPILGNMRITISVETAEWEIGFAGGFVGSGLTNETAGDEVRLGIASFVHLWNTKHPRAAMSFGLGMESGSNIAYYFGPSWRLGDKAALTFGAALGSVTTRQSTIENPATKNVVKWFASLSYTFIGGSEGKLKEPFAGGEGQEEGEGE